MSIIHAYWNESYRSGRIRLNLPRSLQDLATRGELTDGTSITLNSDDDFEVDALIFDNGEWFAILDMSTIRYYYNPTNDE